MSFAIEETPEGTFYNIRLNESEYKFFKDCVNRQNAYREAQRLAYKKKREKKLMKLMEQLNDPDGEQPVIRPQGRPRKPKEEKAVRPRGRPSIPKEEKEIKPRGRPPKPKNDDVQHKTYYKKGDFDDFTTIINNLGIANQ